MFKSNVKAKEDLSFARLDLPVPFDVPKTFGKSN